jgi:penicillin-binding protein-related factor A (putative recombinase)
MPKMRTFTFIDGSETKTVDALSYKKAVRSFQSGSKSKSVRVEWIAKKGGEYEKQQTLPYGRSKKIARW